MVEVRQGPYGTEALKKRGLDFLSWNDLEQVRMTTGISVSRFCEITGIPRPTRYRWRSSGSATKGPWPTPLQDVIESDVKELASKWEAWGHRPDVPGDIRNTGQNLHRATLMGDPERRYWLSNTDPN